MKENQKIDLFCVSIFSIFFIILMQVHIMSALISGLLTYTLTIKLDDFLSNKMTRFSDKSKLLSVLILSFLIMTIFIGSFWYIFTWFISIAKHPMENMKHIQSIILQVSNALPNDLNDYFPNNSEIDIKEQILSYSKEHVFYLQTIISKAFHILVIIIIGMIIGLILGFQANKTSTLDNQPKQTFLIQALNKCLDRLVLVFQYVAISQLAIALFNAFMTSIFLFVILPIFDISLPFRKSLIVATFIFGLIPIVGNLIVNVIMFLVSFTISFKVALIVIVYLILIHKVEYILNAKIIGTKIKSGIYELIISMLFFETIFGIIGLVFAPIFYAFIKLSLKENNLI